MFGGVLSKLLTAGADDMAANAARKSLGNTASRGILSDLVPVSTPQPRVPVNPFDELGVTSNLADDLPIYHGSSPDNIASIRSQGLMFDPDGRNNLTGLGNYGVSTSINPDVARKYSAAYGGSDILDGSVPGGTKVLTIDSGGNGVDDLLSFDQLKKLQDSKYGAVIDKSAGQEDEVRLLQDFINRGAQEASAEPSKLIDLARRYGSPEAMSDDLRGTGSMFRAETGLGGRDVLNLLRDEYPGQNPHEAIRTIFKNNTFEPVADKPMAYAMSHRPTRTGATADNVTQEISDSGLPNDFYDHPEYYAIMNEPTYRESFEALKKIRGNPKGMVTIYRAGPKNQLNEGDWVTLSPQYAKGESLAEGTPVHSFKVRADEIQFAGDDINEFGYWPNGGVD